MLVNPLPLIVTTLRLSQSSNALSGISVTVAGIVTRTARVLPANVPAVNAVTGLPPKVSGIVRLVVSNETPVTVEPLYVHTFPDVSVHSSAHVPIAANAANSMTISFFICTPPPFPGLLHADSAWGIDTSSDE